MFANAPDLQNPCMNNFFCERFLIAIWYNTVLYCNYVAMYLYGCINTN